MPFLCLKVTPLFSCLRDRVQPAVSSAPQDVNAPLSQPCLPLLLRPVPWTPGQSLVFPGLTRCLTSRSSSSTTLPPVFVLTVAGGAQGSLLASLKLPTTIIKQTFSGFSAGVLPAPFPDLASSQLLVTHRTAGWVTWLTQPRTVSVGYHPRPFKS